MNAWDQEDTNSIKPTYFDEIRIEDMSVGDSVEGETGNWKIMRYKQCYVLSLFNHSTYKNLLEFKNSSSLLNFLKK